MAPLLERQHAAGMTATERALRVDTGDAQLTPPPTPPGVEDIAAKAAPPRSRRRPGGDDALAGSAPAEGAFVCRTCSRRFPSFQALGGHRTGHTRQQARQQKPARASHECAVCGLEFAMGQALGGHMRRHKHEPEAQARVEVELEKQRRKEKAPDASCPPPLEEHRGGDRPEGCSSGSGSQPRLLNLLV